jgi:hypothetical protein
LFVLPFPLFFFHPIQIHKIGGIMNFDDLLKAFSTSKATDSKLKTASSQKSCDPKATKDEPPTFDRFHGEN